MKGLGMDKLSEFLKKYPSRNLSIEGHTDSRGSDGSLLASTTRDLNPSDPDFPVCPSIKPNVGF
jgi:hypothetical protein